MKLNTAFESSHLLLSNRIVMAPMTRQRAEVNGDPTSMMATYYSQRASAGLIITEATPISPEAVGYPCIPRIYSESHIQGWKKVTEAVHAKGGKIFLQLWHVGRISHPFYQPNGEMPMAPSEVQPSEDNVCYLPDGKTTYPKPRAMTKDDISKVVNEYTAAAEKAMRAGFDGVEIHGANGYLIDQFLRDKTNLRTDEYGGDIDNRVRFLKDIVDAVVKTIGNEKVGVRISPINSYNDIEDSNPQALFNHVAKRLSTYDLAYLHVAEGVIGEGPAVDFDFNELKSHYKGVYIANGGYTGESAEDALSNERADLIAFGAPYIANPDLVERLATQSPLNDVDYNTCYAGGEKGYIDYPVMS